MLFQTWFFRVNQNGCIQCDRIGGAVDWSFREITGLLVTKEQFYYLLVSVALQIICMENWNILFEDKERLYIHIFVL